MADLTITSSSVLKTAAATQVTGIAGEAITAGQSVYKDLTDSSKLKLADADAATTAVCAGVALNDAASGQPITYISTGDYNPGATVVIGTTYAVAITAGGIAPIVDILTGDFTTHIGIATTTSNIKVNINVGGVAQA